MEFTFEIPTIKEIIVQNAVEQHSPIPVDEKGDPQFTKEEWVCEYLIREVMAIVLNYERSVAQKSVIEDKTVISKKLTAQSL